MKYQCPECASNSVIASETVCHIYSIDDNGNTKDKDIDQKFKMGYEDTMYECDYCGYLYRAATLPALLKEMEE